MASVDQCASHSTSIAVFFTALCRDEFEDRCIEYQSSVYEC